MRSHYLLYQDSRKKWRFRLVAGNGENVGPASEAYANFASAKRGALDHKKAARWARVVVDNTEKGT